jgi:hypothetical protein
MSTEAAIQNRRHRENVRRMAMRAVRREAQEKTAEEEDKQRQRWEDDHKAKLKTAIERGLKRIERRFGRTQKQRKEDLDKELQGASDSVIASRGLDCITRLLSEAKPRKISTIDGEWVPPSQYRKYGKGKRKLSEPIVTRMFGLFDGYAYTRFNTIEELLKHELVPENSGRWYFSHGGGNADHLFFLTSLIKGLEPFGSKDTWRIRPIPVGGKLLMIDISQGNYYQVTDKEGLPVFIEPGVPLEAWHSRYSWTFIDSIRIYQSSLAEIGRTIGLEKAKDQKTVAYLQREFVDKGLEKTTDLEHYSQANKRKFYADVPLDVLQEYNEQDCRILWEALDRYQITVLELGGQMGRTGASSALDVWRRAYLSRDIHVNRTANDVVEYGNAYVASRVEPFRLRFDAGRTRKRIYRYDVNSSFPASALRPMPAELHKYDAGPIDPKDFCDQFGLGEEDRKTNPVVLAHVSIEVPAVDERGRPLKYAAVPPLPIRTGRWNSDKTFVGENIYFPTGAWQCFLLTPDIELLLQYGGKITAVHRTWTFYPFDDLREFYLDVYRLRNKARKDGDRARQQALKLLLNSLYGKYAESEVKVEFRVNPTHADMKRWKGTRESDERTSPENPFYVPGGDEPEVFPVATKGMEFLFGNIARLEREHTVYHRDPIISAYITADARARLTRHLWSAIDRRGEIFYTDTDSTDVTVRLPVGTELGELKLEAIIKKAVYAQPKTYLLEGWEVDSNGKAGAEMLPKRKHKGFRGLDAEMFEALLQGEAVEQRRMLGVTEQLKVFEEQQAELQRLGLPVELSYDPREFIFQKKIAWPRVPKRCYLDDAGKPIKADLKRDWTPAEIRKAKSTKLGLTRPWTVDELRAQGQEGVRKPRVDVAR